MRSASRYVQQETEVRDLTDKEYAATYADGTGGHVLPPHVLEQLAGHDDPDAVPPK